MAKRRAAVMSVSHRPVERSGVDFSCRVRVCCPAGMWSWIRPVLGVMVKGTGWLFRVICQPGQYRVRSTAVKSCGESICRVSVSAR